jgi:hypothetical protein
MLIDPRSHRANRRGLITGLAALTAYAALPKGAAAQDKIIGGGVFKPAAAATGLLTAWNNSDKASNLQVTTTTVANDTVTENSGGGGTYGTIRTTTGISGGVGRFKVRINSFGSGNCAVGFANAAKALGPGGNGYLGADTDSFQFTADGSFVTNGGGFGSPVADAYTANDDVEIELDYANGKARMSVNGGTFKPVAGSSITVSGTWYGASTPNTNGASATLLTSNF